MGTDYSPNNFLRKTPNGLLEQYFKTKGVEPKVEIEFKAEGEEKELKTIIISKLEETQVEPILKLIEALDAKKQALLERDFRDLTERACKAGVMCLIEESRWEEHGLDIADDLEQMENHYERAMWVFLNYPKVFKNSGSFQRMDGITFKKAFAYKGLNPMQFDDELEDFKEKMIAHYKEEGRGKHCIIEVLKRTMPERYCYFVYLEDYGDILNEFEGDEFKRRAIKPAFEVIFVYHPESGRIETNAKGKKDQVKKLHEAFCQGVLEMEGLPDSNSTMYNLEKLKNRFDFRPRDPQDNITSVKLKSIELQAGYKKRISFTDSDNDSDIYDLIDNALNKENLPLDAVKVTKARIQIVFRKMPQDRRTPSVAFDIGMPDRCTLKDSPLHQTAQKYVEKWGLVSDEVIEPKKDKDAETHEAA
jgi:hypothetical protein